MKNSGTHILQMIGKNAWRNTEDRTMSDGKNYQKNSQYFQIVEIQNSIRC